MILPHIDPNHLWAKLQFSADVRLRLYGKLAKMLDNDLPVLKCLEDLYFRASDGGRKKMNPLAIVLADLSHTVRSGQGFGIALTKWVPKFEQMLISAGEESGDLTQAMRSAINFVQSNQRIRKAVFGGLAYPLVLLSMAMGYLFLFGLKVIPKFAEVIDPNTWHGQAKSLYIMSRIVQDWSLPVAILMIAATITILISLAYWRGRIRIIFDKFPPWSIYQLVVGSSFLTAFSALVASGVTVERALIRLISISSPWLRERLDATLLGVKSGDNFGEALRQTPYGFPSKEIIDDLCIYASYSGFAEALRKVADDWRDEGILVVEARMKLVNSGAMMFMAVIIIWIVGGFFGIQQEISDMTKQVSH